MITIFIKNSSTITVYDDKDVIYIMNRKEPIPFSKLIGEIFQYDKKVAEVELFFYKKKNCISRLQIQNKNFKAISI